jgi:hypothetical protein
LSSEQTAAEFYVIGAANQTTTALALPLGQVALQRWTFDTVGGLTREQIVAALNSGKLGARVKTQRYPNGEITGLFIRDWGWRKMQKPPAAGKTVTKARTDGEAVRFLNQATFGATPEEVALRAEDRISGLDRAAIQKNDPQSICRMCRIDGRSCSPVRWATMTATRRRGKKPGGKPPSPLRINSDSAWHLPLARS